MKARHPNAHTAIVQLIRTRISALSDSKDQIEIAREAGFQNANVLSMIKSGVTKVPLDRVPGLAKALDVDPAHLFRLALQQDGYSSIAAVVDQIFGTIVTSVECAWLDELRVSSGGLLPAPTRSDKAWIQNRFAGGRRHLRTIKIELTENEIELLGFHRLISKGEDPKVTLRGVQTWHRLYKRASAPR